MGGSLGFIDRTEAQSRELANERLQILFPRAPRLFVALFQYWWRTLAIKRLQRMGY